MGTQDTSCLRCALFATDETPPPITSGMTAPAQPVQPTPAPSAPLPSFLPPPQAQAPASAPGRPVAPPTMPAPPVSPGPPAYPPTSKLYDQCASQRVAAPAPFPSLVTIVSMVMSIFAFLVAMKWPDIITAPEVCNKILIVGVYGVFSWALLTRQPWARKWSIPAVIGLFCVSTVLSIATYQQQQVQLIKTLLGNGEKLTTNLPNSMPSQANPMLQPMSTPPPPDATSSTPAMTPPTPSSSSALPAPTPGMPTMPSSSKTPGINAPGSFLSCFSSLMWLAFLRVFLIIAIVFSAALNGFFLIALTRPSVIDAFGE